MQLSKNVSEGSETVSCQLSDKQRDSKWEKHKKNIPFVMVLLVIMGLVLVLMETVMDPVGGHLLLVAC